MLLQIARFLADIAVLDSDQGRYRHPRRRRDSDKFCHDSYPAAPPPRTGRQHVHQCHRRLGSSAVPWTPLRRLSAWRREELFQRVQLDDQELPEWEEVSRRLRVPHHQGVISQFEGYDDLAELDWDAYRRAVRRHPAAGPDPGGRGRHGEPLQSLRAGRRPHARLPLLPRGTAAAVPASALPLDEIWRKTVDYYLQRTSHGSTLSELVHGWVLARVRRRGRGGMVQEALEADIADIQGGTTGEGIHLGAMAGTLDLVQRGLTGLETREDALWVDPVPASGTVRYGTRCAIAATGVSAYGCRADSCASAYRTRRSHRSAWCWPTGPSASLRRDVHARAAVEVTADPDGGGRRSPPEGKRAMEWGCRKAVGRAPRRGAPWPPQYGGGVHGLSNPSQLRSRDGKKPHDGGPDRTGDRDGRRVLSGLGGIGGGVVLVPVLVVLGLTAQEAGGTLPAALLMPLGLLGTFGAATGTRSRSITRSVLRQGSRRKQAWVPMFRMFADLAECASG